MRCFSVLNVPDAPTIINVGQTSVALNVTAEPQVINFTFTATLVNETVFTVSHGFVYQIKSFIILSLLRRSV